MATLPPTKEERDANLDALKKAVEEWGDEEVKRLDNETKFLRAVLKGRKADEAGTKNLYSTSRLALAEVDQFLKFTPEVTSRS